MNSKHFLMVAALLAALGLSLVGCGSQATSETVNLTLRAHDIGFDATALDSKANQTVKLTYINDGVIDHAFAISGLVKEQKVKPGQSFTFTFTPPTAGAFKYYCALAGHEAAGMVGTFTVAP